MRIPGDDGEGYGPRSEAQGIIARGRRGCAKARARTLIVCARIIVVRANGILLHAEEGTGDRICERACVCWLRTEQPYVAVNSETETPFRVNTESS